MPFPIALSTTPESWHTLLSAAPLAVRFHVMAADVLPHSPGKDHHEATARDLERIHSELRSKFLAAWTEDILSHVPTAPALGVRPPWLYGGPL